MHAVRFSGWSFSVPRTCMPLALRAMCVHTVPAHQQQCSPSCRTCFKRYCYQFSQAGHPGCGAGSGTSCRWRCFSHAGSATALLYCCYRRPTLQGGWLRPTEGTTRSHILQYESPDACVQGHHHQVACKPISQCKPHSPPPLGQQLAAHGGHERWLAPILGTWHTPPRPPPPFSCPPPNPVHQHPAPTGRVGWV